VVGRRHHRHFLRTKATQSKKLGSRQTTEAQYAEQAKALFEAGAAVPDLAFRFGVPRRPSLAGGVSGISGTNRAWSARSWRPRRTGELLEGGIARLRRRNPDITDAHVPGSLDAIVGRVQQAAAHRPAHSVSLVRR
jgi:hypothetical protein